MHKVAVIIPYFQREPGILTRALNSIQSQYVPDDWIVEVIVVDDASPCPAHSEVRDLDWKEPLRLKVVRQENGGAAAARNRGLDEVDQSTSLIAFLDSDDSWPANHLARGIQAFEAGFDFYFTDNSREGFHESHWHSPFLPETSAFLDASTQKSGLLEIPLDLLIGLTISEVPSQMSTVIYRRQINDGLRFETNLKASGEDVLFLTCLVASAARVCCDLDSRLECGKGLNMYFSNLDWNSNKFLSIKVDIFLTHRLTAARVTLSPQNTRLNDRLLAKCRSEVAFHLLRTLLKNPTRAARELTRLARMAPGDAIKLPIDLIRVSLGRGPSLTEPKRLTAK